MIRLYLFAQVCHCRYVSKDACGEEREHSLPWREGGKGEGVSVSHGGCSVDMMRTATEDMLCQVVVERNYLDAVNMEVGSRSCTVPGRRKTIDP